MFTPSDGKIVITEQPASVGEITVKCGGELKLHVCAMSEVGEPLQFVWHKNGNALSGGGETLEIKPFTVADIGSYKCVVRTTSSGKLVETNEVKVSFPGRCIQQTMHNGMSNVINGFKVGISVSPRWCLALLSELLQGIRTFAVNSTEP